MPSNDSYTYDHMTPRDIKAFSLNIGHFWPRECGVRPEAALLISVIDNVTSRGLISEVLLPLIWQVRHAHSRCLRACAVTRNNVHLSDWN